MRPERTRIGAILALAAALPAAAAAQPVAAAAQPVEPAAQPVAEGGAPAELPPVSAHPPLAPPPALGIAELLPPGVRPPGDASGWAPVPDPAGDDAPAAPDVLIERVERAAPDVLIERVERAARAGDAPEPIRVEYTIDRELEGRIRELLERDGIRLGNVLLMDAVSGALLAYLSTDPVAFPATRTYPTASLAKVVTAAAVLRRAPQAASRECRYIGSPYAFGPTALVAPLHGGRVDPFWRALATSNNQCFARLAVGDVGAEAMLSEMQTVGLFDAPAPGHPAGRFEPVRDELDLGRLGSGLAGSFISPLAALRLAALLASGELVQPHWIASARDADGHPLPLPAPAPPQRVWLPEIADHLRELLVGVTTRGTAKSAFQDASGAPLLGPVRVSGKTGTLNGEDPPGLYRWFIGVAPADAPRIAIAALVVEDEHTRHTAAQVAAEVLQEVFCGDGACGPERLEARMAAWVRAHPDPAPLEVAEEEPPGRVDAALLDETLRPVVGGAIDLPRRLMRRKVDGQIVLELELSPSGEVTSVRVDSSNLPGFERFVSKQVSRWRFTPPTRGGRPVEARARLPISIRVD